MEYTGRVRMNRPPMARLVCGHIFHHGCAKALLERRWNGPAISFGFADCPLCKRETGLNLSQ